MSRKVEKLILWFVLMVSFVFSVNCVGPAAVRGVWLRASLPIKISAVGSSCYPATDAADYWNRVTGLTLFRVDCVQSGDDAVGSPVIALPQMEGACIDADELFGCAQRTFSQWHVTESAVVFVNHKRILSQWDPWAEPTSDVGPDHLEQVYRHELGHVLGLQHAEGTVMDSWRQIDQASGDQVDLLRKVYALIMVRR